MEKQYTLPLTTQQEIKLAQIVHSNYDSYVIYEICRHQHDTEYKLINTDTLETVITDCIKTIHEYTDTGFFYDSDNPRYMPFEEVGKLLTETDKQEFAQAVNNNLQFELVDYSKKALALFGDTKSIKDLLSAMGGKFNSRLTHNDKKKAGWIFSKSKQSELNTILNLNN